MERYGRYLKTLLYSSFLFIFSGSVVLAELTLDLVYPTVGNLEHDLVVTLTGTGFDENTRVSMTLDVGNKRSILGSIGVPGDAMDVCVVGDIAYVADYDLQIYRIGTTNPPSIEKIGYLPTPGDAVAVTVVGNIAYMADGNNGLRLIDVSNPKHPDFIDGDGHWSVAASENSEAWDVAVADQIAYVAYGKSGLQVIDVSDPATPVFIGKFDTYDDGRKVNALGVTVVDGKAYVADNGYDKGLLIIDANPSSLTKFGNVTLHDTRDVTVMDNIAYVADGDNGLQIIDVTDSEHPGNPVSINTPGGAEDVTVVERIENVGDQTVIKQIAYVADGPGGLQIIDVTDSNNPDKIGSVDDSGWAWGLSVVGDRAYVANGISLLIVDVSNPAPPEVIAAIETSYVDDDGNVIDGTARGIALVENSAFLAVEGIGLQKVDIKDPKNPVILPFNTPPTYDSSWGVEIVGDMAYMADWSVFHLIELSTSTPIELLDPWPPDPPPEPHPDPEEEDNFGIVGVTVVDEKAYVSCGEFGLRVVDVNPNSPNDNYLKIIGAWIVDPPPNPPGPPATAPWDVAVAIVDNKTYALVAYGQSGLQVIQIEPDLDREGYLILEWRGSYPKPEDIYDTEGLDARSITMIQGLAYLTNGNQLQVIDISTPADPKLKNSLELQDFAENLTVDEDEDKAYVAIGASGIQVIDISDHDTHIPKIIGLVETLGYAKDVAVSDSIAYVADEGGGLVIVPVPLELESSNVTFINETNKIDATLPRPKIAGHYSLQVFNDTESDGIPGAVTFLEPEDYQQQSSGKKAIIVAGHRGTADYLWEATRQAANMAYMALLSQGYKSPDWNNILYLSPEPTDVDGDGSNDVGDDDEFLYDYVPSIENLGKAITKWALGSDELLLFMVDHGGSGKFQLNYDQILEADTLRQWLDYLQTTPHPESNKVTDKVRVIYDACNSGSFIPLLLPPPGKERTVVTSSRADEYAWFLNQGVLSFSYQFWAHILLDGYLADAFNVARKMMRYDQTALLDADGNGIPNEITDVISDIVIGRGRVAASTPPHIGSVSPEQTLSGVPSTTIWAKDIISLNPPISVWAVIIPPLYRSPDFPVTDLDIEPKDLSGPDTDGTWEREVNSDDFPKTGTYQVLIYAKDNDGNISLPRQTTIIQAAGTGCGADLDGDNDADGLDLVYYSIDNKYLTLEQFANDFGKTDCSIAEP